MSRGGVRVGDCTNCRKAVFFHAGSDSMGSQGLPWWAHENDSPYCYESSELGAATPSDNPDRKHPPECRCDLRCKPLHRDGTTERTS